MTSAAAPSLLSRTAAKPENKAPKLRMLAIEGAVPGGTPYLFAGL